MDNTQLVTTQSMEFHEAANIFPILVGDEYRELRDDIAQNGLIEPIWIYQGKIIDGRNRYIACMELGIEPKYREWNGGGSLVSFVVSLNLKRRHLSSSQRAVVGLEVEKALAQEAKVRQINAAIETNRKLGRLPGLSENERVIIGEHTSFICPDCMDLFDREVWHCPICNHHWPMEREDCWNCHEGKRPGTLVQLIEQASGRAAKQAAEIVGTNRQYISDAKRIASGAPDLLEKVRMGEMSIPEAKRRMDVHFSSESPEWNTPQGIIGRVLAVLNGIDLDPCSNSLEHPNVPAKKHYTVNDDGLSQPWNGKINMNPPYGREIDNWIDKLCHEHEAGRTIEAIALVPARTDTRWWYKLRDYPICFIYGRLTFGDAENAAPFPSALIYLGNDIDRFYYSFNDIGDVWQRIEPGMFGE